MPLPGRSCGRVAGALGGRAGQAACAQRDQTCSHTSVNPMLSPSVNQRSAACCTACPTIGDRQKFCPQIPVAQPLTNHKTIQTAVHLVCDGPSLLAGHCVCTLRANVASLTAPHRVVAPPWYKIPSRCVHLPDNRRARRVDARCSVAVTTTASISVWTACCGSTGRLAGHVHEPDECVPPFCPPGGNGNEQAAGRAGLCAGRHGGACGCAGVISAQAGQKRMQGLHVSPSALVWLQPAPARCSDIISLCGQLLRSSVAFAASTLLVGSFKFPM